MCQGTVKNVTHWKTRDAEPSLIQSLSLSICRDSGFLEQVGGSPVGAVLPTVRGRERSDFCDKATPCLVQSATIGDFCCGWCHFSTAAHFSPILQHNNLGSNISPGLRVLMKQICMLFSCQSVFCARSLLLKPEVWKKVSFSLQWQFLSPESGLSYTFFQSMPSCIFKYPLNTLLFLQQKKKFWHICTSSAIKLSLGSH